MAAVRPKRFVAVRDFSIDGHTYKTGDAYTPDRHFERLTRGGFVATTKKETDHGNG